MGVFRKARLPIRMMRDNASAICLLLASLVALLLFPSCGKKESVAEDSTLQKIVAEKKIRVGYANEAPYAYQDPSNDRLTGEAPEIARMILKGLVPDGDSIEVEGVLTEFSSLIPGLKAGRFDMIAAGMYIKPDRCREIAFSNPTYSVGEAFAVKEGNPKGLHSYADVAAHNDATLGVVAGAVERQYARDTHIPENRVIVFPDAPSALAGVRAGRVDAYAGTSLTVQDLLTKDKSGEMERAEPFSDPVIDGQSIKGYGAFGFRKEDSALVKAVNQGLQEFIGTPLHQETVRPFGFTASEMPGDMQATVLCEETSAK